MDFLTMAATADTKFFVIAVIIGFGIGLAGGLLLYFKVLRKK